MAPPYVGKCLCILSDQIRPKVQISAIYRRIFKPKIFTDITTPVKQSYSQILASKHRFIKVQNLAKQN